MKKAVMMALCAVIADEVQYGEWIAGFDEQDTYKHLVTIFEFDITVTFAANKQQYRKTSNFKYSWFDKYYKEDRKSRPDDFAVINKVYRSDLRTLPAAALDVQLSIMKDTAAPKRAYIWPLPIINVVRAVKYTP